MESRGSLLLRLRVTTVGMENFYLKFNSERDKAAFLLSLYHSGTKLPFFFSSLDPKRQWQDAIVINLWISVEIAREMLFSPFDVLTGSRAREECSADH
jgi:hypothetical protein